MTVPTTKRKAACFTDIHWGRKNNSEQHNQDCLDYVDWFCEQVKNEGNVDHIIFLGDWFEHRSAINGLTLDYAYEGAKRIKALGLPVYFIVGNHDLYYRTTRDVASTNWFESLGFNLVKDEPVVFDDLGEKGTLICPFLFEEEYATLAKHFDVPVWFGHFEFKGFVVTGDTKKMDHGPDPSDFGSPKRIFSGHFHKRQQDKNVVYIGNTFPVDFSDANDMERGMMFYDYDKDDVKFVNWDGCPTYIRTTFSSLVKDAKKVLRERATVSCTVDIDLNYEDSLTVKEQLTKKYGLRDISLKENPDKMLALEDTTLDDEELEALDTTNELVINMLGKIEAESIDNDILIDMYKKLGSK